MICKLELIAKILGRCILSSCYFYVYIYYFNCCTLILLIIGYYIYTETSQGPPGAQFIIESPLIYSSDSFCLQFWFNRNGATIGPLYVNDYSTRLHTIQGNYEDVWNIDRINIPPGLHKVK